MAPPASPPSSRKGGWVASTAHGGRLREDFADSLSQGVFVMRKAPSVPKRSTARKAFVPLVPDETHEGMESRRDAYRASWAATDAHISRVLAEANADAFEKLERFVTSRFAEREATRRANGGAVPPHVAQQIPVGLVLAGGVNSDDHEETFEKLTRHLRERGCHTAILRSRDLRARAAGAAAAAAAVADATLEDDADDDAAATAAAVSSAIAGAGGLSGGGLGVAARCVLAQLVAGSGAAGAAFSAANRRASGRSVRHIKRWYAAVTAPDEATRGDEVERVESRGRSHRGGGDPPPPPKHPPKPVVIVVEDCEGFDGSALGDFFLALSDAGADLPVCVLLGVATSAAMTHGMLPAAVAARLRAREFKLWSPKSIMTAVQERVVADPRRVPALGNDALELIATRFKEHDFSLSAARRAVHLLTLDHFMNQPLSAMAPAAAGDEEEPDDRAEPSPRGEGEGEGAPGARDENALARDAAAREKDATRRRRALDLADAILTPKSVAWARKHLPSVFDPETLETVDSAPDPDREARRLIADAVANAYPARRRWRLALRCAAAAAKAVGAKTERAALANLLVDATRPEWMPVGGQQQQTRPAEEGRGWYGRRRRRGGEPGRGGSQGESLARLLAARLASADACPASSLASLVREWRALVALDDALEAEHGAFLRETGEALREHATGGASAGEGGGAAGEEAADAEADEAEAGEAGNEAEAEEAEEAGEAGAGAAAEDGTAGEPPPPAGESANAPPPSSPAPPAPAPAPAPSAGAGGAGSPDGAAAVAAALAARRRGGDPARARALELAASERARGRRNDESENEAAARGDRTSAGVIPSSAAARLRGADEGGGPVENEPVPENDAESAGVTAARRRAASFLTAALRAHASRPPASLPAHELFCVSERSTAALRRCVQAAPRLALEQTLASPREGLLCACCPRDGGPSASAPDACAAYGLLQDLGDAANVHEWFRRFCELHEGGAVEAGERRRGKGGKRARGEGGAGGGGASDEKAEKTRGEAEAGTGTGAKGTFGLEKNRLWELQARFTRAVAELEFLGVARPVKRRKVEYMQRTAFPLDQLLEAR